MRPFSRLLLSIALAAAVWLADSLLLSFISGSGFAAAFWSGAGPARLTLRLALITGLLLLGFGSYILHKLRYDAMRRLPRRERERLFGAADSAQQGSRLLYHSMRLAALFKMRPRERERLRLLCYCHDIGLVGVPGGLDRPYGALSGEQRRQYDAHIDLGAAIAAEIPVISRAAGLIACHEEYYDGSGAKGMYGCSIPLACRILTAVRMYDHYTHIGRAGQALSSGEALRELELYSGSLLDPEVVAALNRLLSDERLGMKLMDHVYAAR